MTKEEKIREQEALASCKYYPYNGPYDGHSGYDDNDDDEKEEYMKYRIACYEAAFVRDYVSMKDPIKGRNPFLSRLSRYEKCGLTHFMENDGRLMCFKAFFLCILNKDCGPYEVEAQTFKEFYLKYYG